MAAWLQRSSSGLTGLLSRILKDKRQHHCIVHNDLRNAELPQHRLTQHVSLLCSLAGRVANQNHTFDASQARTSQLNRGREPDRVRGDAPSRLISSESR